MGLAPVVGLEIGTSKVLALVGELREDSHILITGIGQHRSAGVRKGQITDMEAVHICVRSALEAAEESGDVAIREVLLAVSGGHIQSEVNRGFVSVLDRDGEVSGEDIDAVIEMAQTIPLPHERLDIHSLCQYFCVDDQEHIIQPEGMEGARLALDMLIMHGQRSSINTMIKAVKDVPMDVQDVVFSGLCAALAVLTEEQKQSGALIMDFGGGTTDYVVFMDNVVMAAGSLGLGGDHVTNDIVQAFTIPTARAEGVKKEHGSALVLEDEGTSVSLPAEVGFPSRVIDLCMLNTVINARMQETLELIRARIEQGGLLHQLGAGIIITGGAAHLRGLPELTSRVFGLPCSVGRPRNVSGLATVTEGPEFATCCGLVQYGFKMLMEENEESSIKGLVKRLIGR